MTNRLYIALFLCSLSQNGVEKVLHVQWGNFGLFLTDKIDSPCRTRGDTVSTSYAAVEIDTVNTKALVTL